MQHVEFETPHDSPFCRHWSCELPIYDENSIINIQNILVKLLGFYLAYRVFFKGWIVASRSPKYVAVVTNYRDSFVTSDQAGNKIFLFILPITCLYFNNEPKSHNGLFHYSGGLQYAV